MKIIYANILFYSLILYGLVGAAIQRLVSADWQQMKDVKLNYDIIGIIFCLWLITTIYGLLKRSIWAYTHALSLNATLTVIPIFQFIIAVVIIWPNIEHLNILLNHLDHLLVSITAFVFWLALLKSSIIKNAYNKALNLTSEKDAPPS